MSSLPGWARTPPTPGRLFLESRDESGRPRHVPIDGKAAYLFGRNADACDFVIDHKLASRVHACLVHDRDGDCYIQDQGSAHGTYVDGSRLDKKGKALVVPGVTTFSFGSGSLTYRLVEGSAEDFGVSVQNARSRSSSRPSSRPRHDEPRRTDRPLPGSLPGARCSLERPLGRPHEPSHRRPYHLDEPYNEGPTWDGPPSRHQGYDRGWRSSPYPEQYPERGGWQEPPWDRPYGEFHESPRSRGWGVGRMPPPGRSGPPGYGELWNPPGRGFRKPSEPWSLEPGGRAPPHGGRAWAPRGRMGPANRGPPSEAARYHPDPNDRYNPAEADRYRPERYVSEDEDTGPGRPASERPSPRRRRGEHPRPAHEAPSGWEAKGNVGSDWDAEQGGVSPRTSPCGEHCVGAEADGAGRGRRNLVAFGEQPSEPPTQQGERGGPERSRAGQLGPQLGASESAPAVPAPAAPQAQAAGSGDAHLVAVAAGASPKGSELVAERARSDAHGPQLDERPASEGAPLQPGPVQDTPVGFEAPEDLTGPAAADRPQADAQPDEPAAAAMDGLEPPLSVYPEGEAALAEAPPPSCSPAAAQPKAAAGNADLEASEPRALTAPQPAPAAEAPAARVPLEGMHAPGAGGDQPSNRPEPMDTSGPPRVGGAQPAPEASALPSDNASQAQPVPEVGPTKAAPPQQAPSMPSAEGPSEHLSPDATHSKGAHNITAPVAGLGPPSGLPVAQPSTPGTAIAAAGPAPAAAVEGVEAPVAARPQDVKDGSTSASDSNSGGDGGEALVRALERARRVTATAPAGRSPLSKAVSREPSPGAPHQPVARGRHQPSAGRGDERSIRRSEADKSSDEGRHRRRRHEGHDRPAAPRGRLRSPPRREQLVRARRGDTARERRPDGADERERRHASRERARYERPPSPPDIRQDRRSALPDRKRARSRDALRRPSRASPPPSPEEPGGKKPKASGFDKVPDAILAGSTPAEIGAIPQARPAPVRQMMGVPGGAQGFMLQQKKKLLWGKKPEPEVQIPAVDELYGANRWDAAEFDNTLEKEKFEKLMGVRKGLTPAGIAVAPPTEPSEREALTRERQQKVLGDIEGQFMSGLRRADGRTAGLGL